MLKYWEALREAVHPEFCSPPRHQGPLRDLHQNPLQEGTVITRGMIAMQRMVTGTLSPLPRLTTMTRILVMSKLWKKSNPKSREELLGQKGVGEVLPQKYLSRGTLLDTQTNIRVSSLTPHRVPLREHQSDLPTNSRSGSCSYQPARRGPNTPCPLQYVGRDKSQLTMMILMTMVRSMLTGVPVPVGGHPEAITLAGQRGPVVDFSWHYLPPPFSLGKF